MNTNRKYNRRSSKNRNATVRTNKKRRPRRRTNIRRKRTNKKLYGGAVSSSKSQLPKRPSSAPAGRVPRGPPDLMTKNIRDILAGETSQYQNEEEKENKIEIAKSKRGEVIKKYEEQIKKVIHPNDYLKTVFDQLKQEDDKLLIQDE